MTAWQLHSTEPDTWQVFAPWGQCIAIRPRPDHLYPGVKITSCPSRDAGMGVVGRELQQHWPEVA